MEPFEIKLYISWQLTIKVLQHMFPKIKDILIYNHSTSYRTNLNIIAVSSSYDYEV